METFTLNLPTMYGDHHVVEVRRLLMELPGIGDIYASSSFQVLEVQFDDKQVTPEIIETKLGKAGYLGELAVPVERGVIDQSGVAEKPFYRQSSTVEQVTNGVNFAQQAPYTGRPLWPCPGIGTIKRTEEELNYG